MRPVHVALTLDPVNRQTVEAQLCAAGFAPKFLHDRAQLVASLPEVELLLVGRPPRIDWSSAARLSVLQVAGSGVDPLFPAVGLRDEVTVSNCRGAHADAVRDHVIALLLTFARDLPRAFTQQRAHEWKSYPTPALTGRSLCVVGMGEIGRRVSAVAVALGMHVLGVSRSGAAHRGIVTVAADGVRSAVAQADYVVVCIPLTSRTLQLFDDALLDALPTHCVLISVARGGIVDEVALERRLRAGRLRAAALDVFEREPLSPDSSLWDCPGLLLTPHSAGYTPDYLHGVVHAFVDAVEHVSRGQRPLTWVSRQNEY